MKKMIGIAALTLSAIVIWSGSIFVIGSERWLKRPIAADASAQSFVAAAAEIDPTAMANPVRLDTAGFRTLFEKAFTGNLG